MPNQPSNPRRRLFTPEELAEYLSVPPRTLSKWRTDRTGPLFVRMGVHVRYRPEDVDRWLNGLLDDGKDWMTS